MTETVSVEGAMQPAGLALGFSDAKRTLPFAGAEVPEIMN